ncbi:LAME_0D10000g1_1 [Lachancea meyersii CBS 8951]|uniref:LAME_0D10000g1_1 n=1 Tax=Lachancea meyersii CBS 8951 TaxID=1266667 RepID=A0A1G4JBI0_9SACH|nr:LAME_0D10000g1_1 [Lachancea meyersii CBS 8951]
MTSTKTVSKPIPITLLSGFLGSGKTTLLQKILTSDHGLKIAVIINDMAEVNIDSALIQNNRVCQKEEKLIQLQNGCICCTLRGDLLEELVGICEAGDIDYIVIESTGIAEPMQVAETFAQEFSDVLLNMPGGIAEEEEAILNKVSAMGGLQSIAKIDTCVTVIDALNFLANVNTTQFLADRWGESGQGESERTITDLLIDQIEFSDIVIVNKKSLVNKKKMQKIKNMIKALNPLCKVMTADYCDIPLDSVLNTGLYDYEKASTAAGWLQSINELSAREGFGADKKKRVLTPKPETEEYNVNNFVYRQRRPFHPERLYEMLRDKFFVIEQTGVDEVDGQDAEGGVEGNDDDDDEEIEDDDKEEEEEEEEEEELSEAQINKNRSNSPFGAVLRSKGFFWLATRFIVRGEWSSAGPMLTVKGGLPWFDISGFEDVPPEALELIKKDFEGAYGDRRNELVFIGVRINVKALTEALDTCLLNDKEFELFQKITKKNNALEADEELAKVWDDGFEDWMIFGDAGDDEPEEEQQDEK